jgi:hypothetical protein
MKLKEERMDSIQKLQMKHAFFGGMGAMLLLLSADIFKLENPDERIAMLKYMEKQLDDYWKPFNPPEHGA